MVLLMLRSVRSDHILQDMRANIFPFGIRKEKKPEASCSLTPVKRKERSLSSLVVDAPKVSPQSSTKKTKATPKKASSLREPIFPLEKLDENDGDSAEDLPDGCSYPETSKKSALNFERESSVGAERGRPTFEVVDKGAFVLADPHCMERAWEPLAEEDGFKVVKNLGLKKQLESTLYLDCAYSNAEEMLLNKNRELRAILEERDRLKEEKGEADRRVSNLQADKEKLVVEVAKVQDQRKMELGDLNHKLAEVNKVREKLELLRANDRAELKKELRAVLKERDKLKKELVMSSVRVTDLQADKERLGVEVAKLQDQRKMELGDLNHKLGEVNKVREELELLRANDRAELKEELRAILKERDKLKKELGMSSARVADLQAVKERDKLKKELGMSSARVADLQAVKERLGVEVAKLQHQRKMELGDLNHKLDEVKKEKERLREELKAVLQRECS